MKKLLVIFIVLFLSSTYSKTNPGSKDLEYYPLQTGNYFEYKTFSRTDPLPDYDSSAYSIRILGDTILENGKRYKILLQNSIPAAGPNQFSFERIDSLTGSVYRYKNDNSMKDHEYTSDSLFAQAGDTINCSREGYSSGLYFRTICAAIKTDILFGLSVDIKEFHNQSFIPGSDYKLAKGFGFYYRVSSEFSWSMSKLVYAEIDGKKYGKTITPVKTILPGIPFDYKLYQNYPNPFNPSTTISYQLAAHGQVKLNVYDILGNEITTLVNEQKSAGNYQISWDGTDKLGKKVTSGIYFYRLNTDNFVQTKKMIVLK